MSVNESSVKFGLLQFASATVAGYLFFQRRNKRSNSLQVAPFTENVFYPPLPEPIVGILKLSRLCFLATQQEGEPHLSLMNFTYHQEEDAVIICTRKDTKKYKQIVSNPKVAVLIHDFPHLNDHESSPSHGKSWSITLNGECKVVDHHEQREKYRALHLNSNPDYSQFIVGDEIAVIIIRIEKARMCDIHDRVSYWNVKDGFVPNDI